MGDDTTATTRRRTLTAIGGGIITAITGCMGVTAPSSRLPSDDPEAVAEAYAEAHRTHDRSTAEGLIHSNADIEVTFSDNANSTVMETEEIHREEFIDKYVVNEKPDFSELPGRGNGNTSTFVKITFNSPEMECCNQTVSSVAFLAKEHGHWRIHDAY